MIYLTFSESLHLIATFFFKMKVIVFKQLRLHFTQLHCILSKVKQNKWYAISMENIKTIGVTDCCHLKKSRRPYFWEQIWNFELLFMLNKMAYIANDH